MSTNAPERVSASDRRLIASLTRKLQDLQQAADDLQAFVVDHIAATYTLSVGDRVEDDGRIVRAPAPVLPMAPEPTPAPAAPEPTPAE